MTTAKVILLPNNSKLRQLIKEHGPEWTVVKKEQPVQCFRDSTTGIMIVSPNGVHSRWVRPWDIES